MKILGIQCYQDYNLSIYDSDTNSIKYIEIDKLLKRKHFSFKQQILNIPSLRKVDAIYRDNMRNNIYKVHAYIKQILNIDKFDAIAWCYQQFEDGYLKKESYEFVKILEQCPIYTYHHQMNHVYTSLLYNDIDEALAISIDGKGDGNHAVYHYKNGKFNKIYQNMNFSYGMYYEVLSSYFLDTPYYDGLEGKFMAYAGISSDIIDIPNYDIFWKTITNINWNVWEEKENIVKYINKFLSNLNIDKYKLAHTLQQLWIDDILKFIEQYKHISNNLIFSGGCAMNCVLNYQIYKKNWFDNIYYSPIVADTGQSIGALLQYLIAHNIDIPQIIKTFNAFNDINIPLEEYNEGKIAKMLFEGKLIATCIGEIEMGARALGNRSILANPIDIRMKEKLNNIKNREQYRPFGILVPEDEISKYFDMDIAVPYMNMIAYPKLHLYGAEHYDGSVRVQTIKKDEWLYPLLKEFEKLSGIPILINTSFNDYGKPIFNDKQDMLNMVNDKLDGIIFEEGMYLK